MLNNSKLMLWGSMLASLACGHLLAGVDGDETNSSAPISIPQKENVPQEQTNSLNVPSLNLPNSPTSQFSQPTNFLPPLSASPNSQSTESADSSSPLFEDNKQQQKYEAVLGKLRNLRLGNGEKGSNDDWFVVGGAAGNQVNFDAFQGEEEVARKVIEFLEQTNNRCQWRVFSRESDSYAAQENVSKVKSEYQQWRQAQINRANAYRRAQQRAAANSYRRRCSSGGG